MSAREVYYKVLSWHVFSFECLIHLRSSGGFNWSSLPSWCASIPAWPQLGPIHCKQTICPLFIQIISQYAMSALSARQNTANRCTGGWGKGGWGGGKITARNKNAYSTLSLIQKLFCWQPESWHECCCIKSLRATTTLCKAVSHV